MAFIRKGDKVTLKILQDNKVFMSALGKMEAELNECNWADTFYVPFVTTTDTQWRWFQVRILNLILPAEMSLFKHNSF